MLYDYTAPASVFKSIPFAEPLGQRSFGTLSPPGEISTSGSSDSRTMHGADHTSQILDQLCALISALLRPPTPRRLPKLSPAGVAALMLGASMALMLCGSLTFFIGFIMMPWVLGLVMMFYFVGVLSNVSWIGKALLSSLPSAVTDKDISGHIMSRLPFGIDTQR